MYCVKCVENRFALKQERNKMQPLVVTKTELGMRVSVYGYVVGTFDDKSFDCYDVAYEQMLKELFELFKFYSGLFRE